MTALFGLSFKTIFSVQFALRYAINVLSYFEGKLGGHTTILRALFPERTLSFREMDSSALFGYLDLVSRLARKYAFLCEVMKGKTYSLRTEQAVV